MNNMVLRYKKFIASHWFGLLSGAVVLFSAFLRFYKFGDRWGLAYDQAHDAIIAQYALQMHKFPLLGPFSSAGPFQTGGEWYWFIMLGKLFFPFTIMGPWILLVLTQILFVGLMIYVGKIIGGKVMGLVAGLFAAVSPVEIAQAINLTNQSLLNISALLLIIFAVLYLQTKKNKYLFFLGIFTSLGATIHLQGVPLVIFSFFTLIAAKERSKKGIGLFLLGVLLPIAPLIYIDFFHKWFNTKNMLQYFLHDQYKISLDSLGRRWTTYIINLWPLLLGNTLGGNIILGYGFLIAGTALLVRSILKRKFTLSWILIVVTFIIFVYFLKNVRTPIFDSYIMFLHPLIFLISAAIVTFSIRKNFIVGLLLLILVVGFAMQKNILDIKNAANWSSIRARGWVKVLTAKYPGKKFALYDYNFRSTTQSGPLVMYLQYEDKLDDKGYKIGFGSPSKKESVYSDNYFNNEIKENIYGFVMIDLSSSTSAQLAKDTWGPVNPSYMYNAQEDWYK